MADLIQVLIHQVILTYFKGLYKNLNIEDISMQIFKMRFGEASNRGIRNLTNKFKEDL